MYFLLLFKVLTEKFKFLLFFYFIFCPSTFSRKANREQAENLLAELLQDLQLKQFLEDSSEVNSMVEMIPYVHFISSI